MQRICIISDTHGKLDPRVEQLFVGASRILHAGDIGRAQPPIIDRLSAIAPVTAVTGNVDWNTALDIYPINTTIEVEGIRIMMQHIGDIPKRWQRQLPQPTPQIAICGHSHIALIEEYQGVLFINPGSASQPRGQLGEPTVVFLDIQDNGEFKAELIPLKMADFIKNAD
ncbi:metallophosphoesterase family protein [Herpetosiphon llansteffanensis]|uniref:metallophosphoesterase family protein n=1 Tax=Herpetosiphon llansteffanensis TaxID=2094568 RepID=UPI000D7BF8EE|nr:metallophosphoesterase family protein [Herpetosiphon llansteffanensis]